LNEINPALDAIQADEADKINGLQQYCAALDVDDNVDHAKLRDARLPEMIRAGADACASPEAAQWKLVPGSILVGDFNSLSLADHYLPAQWRHIQESRRQCNWEAPQSEVWRVVRRSSFVDVWLHARRDGELQDASLVRFTCWAESRIDYIFAHESLVEACQVVECHIAPTTASDHSAVVGTFELKKQ
jgi:endonuclease/exonuclease/phosphatase family metal-dependent hydrolase